MSLVWDGGDHAAPQLSVRYKGIMPNSMENWLSRTTLIAQVATAIGVIVAILVSAHEIRLNREAREFQSFMTLLNNYDKIREKRQAKWKKIKNVLSKNKKTASEVHDTQNTINYLMLRIHQPERLYAIEYELVSNELQSLNLLNELSRISLMNERAMSILQLSVSDEITFYQKNKSKILTLYATVKRTGRLFKPKYHYLNKIDTGEWFDQAVTKN